MKHSSGRRRVGFGFRVCYQASGFGGVVGSSASEQEQSAPNRLSAQVSHFQAGVV